MYKDLIYSANETSNKMVLAMESRIGMKLSDSFKDFYRKHSGAKFKDAEILAKHSKLGQTSYGVREFFGIEDVGILKIEHWNDDHIAFAEDAFGNFFVLKKTQPDAVYFWEHETDQVDLVSKSFENFLSGIIKIDFDDLPSVKDTKVWIDPDFLKLQKDLGNA